MILISVASVVVVAIAGASVAFVLTRPASGIPAPEVVETPEAEPTPSAVPTVEPPAGPPIRFDTTCDAIVPPSLSAAMLGSSATTRSNATVSSLYEAADRQAGVLTCQWGDGGWDSPLVRVFLVPEAGEVFESARGWREGDTPVVDSLGDASTLTCIPGSETSECWADIRIGDVWLGVQLRGPAGADELRSRLEGAAALIVAAVEEVAVAPDSWVPQVSPLTNDYMWNSAAPLVETAFGIPEPHPAGYDEIGALSWHTWERSGFSMVPFEGSTGEYIHITSLPGGAWAAAAIAQRPGVTAVEIAGADFGSQSSSDAGNEVCFAARGAAICVLSHAAPADLLAEVATYVALLPAA